MSVLYHCPGKGVTLFINFYFLFQVLCFGVMFYDNWFLFESLFRKIISCHLRFGWILVTSSICNRNWAYIMKWCHFVDYCAPFLWSSDSNFFIAKIKDKWVKKFNLSIFFFFKDIYIYIYFFFNISIIRIKNKFLLYHCAHLQRSFFILYEKNGKSVQPKKIG